jgi:ABC-type antimicrobial peptide transport system permease subunit
MLAFAALALLLAMSGLFAVLSHDVARRRREMGVRAALGARRSDLLRLVLRHGLGVTLAGLGAGLLVAAGLAHLMRRVLFGVGPLDGPTFACVPLLLLPIATVACLLPAYRASKTDPSEALRCE